MSDLYDSTKKVSISSYNYYLLVIESFAIYIIKLKLFILSAWL